LVLVLLAFSGSVAAQTPNYAEGDKVPPHQTFTIDSRVLAERRVVNVYLPPGYEADSSTRFPVLYMLDGGLAEDFPHVVNTVDSLIARKVIRPVIVAGIENTERRRDLTGPTAVATDSAIAPHVGASAAFRRFMGEEFIPEVRARYRTTDETTIVGESLAGLFIVETFLVEPSLFQKFIALSPSLWWNHGDLVHHAASDMAGLAGLHRTLYLSSADEGDIAENTEVLAATLRAQAPADLTWSYVPRPDLTHGTIFRAVAPGAFASLLK
jgi:hypothetical protein